MNTKIKTQTRLTSFNHEELKDLLSKNSQITNSTLEVKVWAPLPDKPHKYVNILSGNYDGGLLNYLYEHAEYVTCTGSQLDLSKL